MERLDPCRTYRLAARLTTVDVRVPRRLVEAEERGDQSVVDVLKREAADRSGLASKRAMTRDEPTVGSRESGRKARGLRPRGECLPREILTAKAVAKFRALGRRRVLRQEVVTDVGAKEEEAVRLVRRRDGAGIVESR